MRLTGLTFKPRDCNLTLLKHLSEDVGRGLTHCMISSTVTKCQVYSGVTTSSHDAQSQRRKSGLFIARLDLAAYDPFASLDIGSIDQQMSMVRYRTERVRQTSTLSNDPNAEYWLSDHLRQPLCLSHHRWHRIERHKDSNNRIIQHLSCRSLTIDSSHTDQSTRGICSSPVRKTLEASDRSAGMVFLRLSVALFCQMKI